MTRDEFSRRFPDTALIFGGLSQHHPFWEDIADITVQDIMQGNTILPDIEQACSVIDTIPGYQSLIQQIQDSTTEEELQQLLELLYAAYVYRNHGARISADPSDYHIELHAGHHNERIACALIPHDGIGMPLMRTEIPNMRDTQALIELLRQAADGRGLHSDAAHHVFVIQHPLRETIEHEWSKAVNEIADAMPEYFPHMAGIVIIDRIPHSERAVYIPFHGDDHGLESVLHRHG